MEGRGISTHHHSPGESPVLWAKGEAQTELKEGKLLSRKDGGPEPINQTRTKVEQEVPNRTKNALHAQLVPSR